MSPGFSWGCWPSHAEGHPSKAVWLCQVDSWSAARWWCRGRGCHAASFSFWGENWPSGKLRVSYWTWPFIVDCWLIHIYPINKVMFHSYVELPEGNFEKKNTSPTKDVSHETCGDGTVDCLSWSGINVDWAFAGDLTIKDGGFNMMSSPWNGNICSTYNFNYLHGPQWIDLVLYQGYFLGVFKIQGKGWRKVHKNPTIKARQMQWGHPASCWIWWKGGSVESIQGILWEVS